MKIKKNESSSFKPSSQASSSTHGGCGCGGSSVNESNSACSENTEKEGDHNYQSRK